MKGGCPACGDGRSRADCVVGGYEYRRCGGCRSLFLGEYGARQPLAEFYRDYRRDVVAERRLADYEASGKRLAARFLAHYPGPRGNLLDVGCGLGFFVQAVSSSFSLAVGQEISAAQSAFCRELGIRFYEGPLEELDQGNPFDVATLWDVIEHVPEPSQLLTEVRRHLVPGGYVCLTTPHSAGIAARVCRCAWRPINPPEHQVLFTGSGMEQVARRSGFRVLHRFTLSPDLLNIAAVMRPRSNTSGGSARTDRERSRSARLRNLRGSPWLWWVEPALNRIARTTGLGDTLYAVLRAT